MRSPTDTNTLDMQQKIVEMTSFMCNRSDITGTI